MRRLFATVLVLGLSTGCALRPRYRDFVSETTPGPTAKLVLRQKGSDTTLGNVKLEMSEWKNKVYMTTAADGTFAMPVEKKYLDENPVLVVMLPAGVPGYQIDPAPGNALAPAPTSLPEVPAKIDAPASTASPIPNK